MRGIIVALLATTAFAAFGHRHGRLRGSVQSDEPCAPEQRCTALDVGVLLKWNFTETNISFRMITINGGQGHYDWVALGLSTESYGMVGTDIAMFHLRTGKLEDRWSTGYDTPKLDDIQDKVLQSYVITDQLVTFAFTMDRRNKTCVPLEDVALDGSQKVFVMWAYGKSLDDGTPIQHDDMGSGTVDLFGPLHEPVKTVDDMRYLNAQLPNVTVNATSTAYVCMYMEPPRDAKYHIYGVDLVGNMASVHHMIRRVCSLWERLSTVTWTCPRAEASRSWPAATRA